MLVIGLNEIEYNSNCGVTGIRGLRQHWKDKAFFSYNEAKRPDSGLTFILSGVAEYKYDGGGFTAGAGTVVSIPEGCNYCVSFHADAPDERVNTLLINFTFRDYLGNDIAFSDKPEILLKHSGGGLRASFEKAIDAACGRNSFSCFECFYSLLAKLSRTIALTAALNQSTFPAILDYIEENLGSLESIPKLAGRFAMSESGFRRMFYKEMGMSPISYVTERRIERAKEMLLTSEVTAETICEALGFYDLPYFYKCFEKKTGMSPGKYISEFAKASPESP